jgi:hypothetical protein
VLESEKREKRKRVGWSSQDSEQSGTPDCPVVHRTVSGAPGWFLANWPLSGIRRWRTAIIHRTVRWCTGLSGEPTTASTTVDRQIRGRRVFAPTVGRRHQTVRCAPDSVRCANGYNSTMVGCAILERRSAPDCPVRHPTEGKNCLPRLPPTAPSCLGAIKRPLGAWRR